MRISEILHWDGKSYLTHGILYPGHQVTIFAKNLNNYITRDLLQGVQTNTVQENETLLENVQKFIIKTGGFDR